MMEKTRYKLQEAVVRLKKGTALYSDLPLDNPAAALRVMQKEMAQLDREHLCVVNLNVKMQPINFNIVGIGGLAQAAASIPNVLKSSLLSNAAAFLLLHNHPSGDPTPSQDDIQMTQKVIEAGKIVGIQCLDHIVIGAGEGRSFSFREKNLADFSAGPVMMTAEEILHIAEGGKAKMAEENRRNQDVQKEELTIKFGKGFAENFTAKDGKEYARVAIPNTDPQDKSSWATFVLPAKAVHENKFGKGLWTKLPADGTTTVNKTVLQGKDETGKNIWENVKTEVPNKDLKAMVEAYRNKAPQERSSENRESTRDKLGSLSKDSADKPAPEKQKMKAKAKGQER